MTTLFSALDWRAMSQEARDLGLNNGVAVPGSVEMVAGWEQRSAEMRKRFPAHLDLRYGPRERNRIDFLKAGDGAPTLLFIHGGYWQARAKEVFTVMAEGPDGAWHQCGADRLHAGAGSHAGRNRRRNPCRHRLPHRTTAGAWRGCRRHRGVRLVRRRAPDLDGAVASEGEGGDGDLRASTISSRSATPISTRNCGRMKQPAAATRR